MYAKNITYNTPVLISEQKFTTIWFVMSTIHTLPFISIIIACRNEEKHIGACLHGIVKNGYPLDKVHVIIVDGMSTDATHNVIKMCNKKFKHLIVLENKRMTTPYALNIGAKEIKGDYFFWISAHSVLAKNYIKTCIQTIQKHHVDSVGGLIFSDTDFQKHTIIQQAIANCLNSPFGSGNSAYRSNNISSICSVDTVFGQCFDKNIFNKYGYFNERLTRGQDYEYNQRIIKNGGTILLNPKLVTTYFPPRTIQKYIQKAFTNGYWVVTANYLSAHRFHAIRHYTPLYFVTTLIILAISGLWFPMSWKILFIIIIMYMTANMVFSLMSSLLNKKIILIIIQPIIFIILHFGYGLGSLYGLYIHTINKNLRGNAR